MSSTKNQLMLSNETVELLDQKIEDLALPADFADSVENFYAPLAASISERILSSSVSPCFIGVQGSQGSGKTTCSEFLQLLLSSEHSLNTLVLSIDDFYLSRQHRFELALSEHPLLATRGVPGTHDVELINQVFASLRNRKPVSLPKFDKATDDQLPTELWEAWTKPVDVVLFEGWCVGLEPQDPAALSPPVNALERKEDSDAAWRTFVNKRLAGDYQKVFRQFDFQLVLQAPSFACVYDWRLKQEQKLKAALTVDQLDASKVMSAAQIERFISHYQRLTEHALETMPSRADWVLELNADHSYARLVSAIREKP